MVTVINNSLAYMLFVSLLFPSISSYIHGLPTSIYLSWLCSRTLWGHIISQHRFIIDANRPPIFSYQLEYKHYHRHRHHAKLSLSGTT